MLVRMLRKRAEKLEHKFVDNNPNVKVLDSIIDLVDAYDDELENGENPDIEYIETPRFTKMINELTKKLDIKDENNDNKSFEAEVKTEDEPDKAEESSSVKHDGELSSEEGPHLNEACSIIEEPSFDEEPQDDETQSVYKFRNKRLEPSGSFG
jgi:hypothetical protein